MKAPNIYQYRRHSNYLKKTALDQAMARVAIAELVELGFVVTRFRLGASASITVGGMPSGCPAPLQFVPMGFGFNGRFRYTTFAAAFGDWTVEWHKRIYPARITPKGTEPRIRHYG